MNIFRSTVLKLAAIYLGAILALSLTFSIVAYQSARSQLGLGLPQDGFPGHGLVTNIAAFEALRQQRASEARDTLLLSVVMINLGIVLLGAPTSYWLARKTLAPIEKAMDEQTRFTSDASHELRTPLAVMHAEIEVALRKKKVTEPQMRTLLESTLEEVDRLQGLSNRLLQLTAHDPFLLQSASLEAIAIEAMNRVVPQAQAKQISIQNSVQPFFVMADADSLTDALVILLDNAIKYSPPATEISVRATREGKYTTLSVADRGYGIAPEDLPHIFERFYRADTARSTQQVAGHGLGLSIAQRIAELHDTVLTAVSTPGTGVSLVSDYSTAPLCRLPCRSLHPKI